MKFYAALPAVFLAIAAPTAAQQGAGTVPPCAQPCVNELTSGNAIGGCNSIDIACICSNEDFLSKIACCVARECTPDEQKETIAFAKKICQSGGVTDLPDEVVCNEASASGSAAAESTTGTGTAASGASTSDPASQTSAASDASETADASDNETSSDNAGPVATMAPAGLLGGVIAALVLL